MPKKSGPGKKGVAIKHEHFLNRSCRLSNSPPCPRPGRGQERSAAGAAEVPLHRLVEPDEFFEIRVSGLKSRSSSAVTTLGPDGMTPLDVFAGSRAQGIVEKQYRLFNEEILPALRRKASASCAVPNGRRRNRNGSATISSAR
jgi:hypothetical protein